MKSKIGNEWSRSRNRKLNRDLESNKNKTLTDRYTEGLDNQEENE